MSNTLIILLFISLSEEDQAPYNTFILFFPHHCQLLGIYWNGNHVGRCSHVGGVGRYLLKMLVGRKVEGQVSRKIDGGGGR